MFIVVALYQAARFKPCHELSILCFSKVSQIQFGNLRSNLHRNFFNFGVEILLFDLRGFAIQFASDFGKNERKKMNDTSFGE